MDEIILDHFSEFWSAADAHLRACVSGDRAGIEVARARMRAANEALHAAENEQGRPKPPVS